MRVVAAAILLAIIGVGSGVPAVQAKRPLGLDLYRPVPDGNPLTPAKVNLGRRLFRDRRLSRDGSMACASCHDPRRAFTDGEKVGKGVGGVRGTRNVPTIVNRAWGRSFFWDGRAPTLEDQVLLPILHPNELAMTRRAPRPRRVQDAHASRGLSHRTAPYMHDGSFAARAKSSISTIGAARQIRASTRTSGRSRSPYAPKRTWWPS